ncbi:hypothetical protein BSKO_08443 [Bryopsis sp. KO-2023]|nr:hypothetical protein BSKO_08443 [Bryopsis sp. KO-2023]
MAYSSEAFARDVRSLADIIGQGDQESLPSNVSAPQKGASINPGNVGPQGLIPGAKPPAVKKRDTSKDIWQDDDLDDYGNDDLDDGRTQPQYDFVYKQAVETTDAFLGMGMKDVSSACCEEMVVKVDLPGTESVGEIDLDVKEATMTLRSPLYKLSIYLPHKVLHEKGKAKWDGGKQQLSVALPVIREDYLP